MANYGSKTDNKAVKAVLQHFNSFSELPKSVREFFEAYCHNAGNGNKGISINVIFNLLRTIDEISTSIIVSKLDIKDRQARKYRSVLEKCNTLIADKVTSGVIKIEEEEKPMTVEEMHQVRTVYLNGMTRDFTEPERECIRYLSIHGSTEQAKAFIERLVRGDDVLFIPQYPSFTEQAEKGSTYRHWRGAGLVQNGTQNGTNIK
ncbi:hypothetical protein ACUB4Z_002173 [Klebsiella pneumoniae]